MKEIVMAPPVVDFGRDVCGNLEEATAREWLVTNGIGGYASGTVAGLLTRRYHGTLFAALKPPLGRTLLLAKLDETAYYDGRPVPLFANRWAGDTVDPQGFKHLERFHLEGMTPVWTFALGDALLEKRIWMQQGANRTYVRYDLVRGTLPLSLAIKALVNYRDHHGTTHAGDWTMRVARAPGGLQVIPFDGATPLYLLSDRAESNPEHNWYRNFFLRTEAYRGLDAVEDHLHAGTFRATLHPGQSLTLVAGTEAPHDVDGTPAYADRQAYERSLIARSERVYKKRHGKKPAAAWRHLTLAADQFVVHRPLPNDSEGYTIIAGYPWFGDWGRDTMISLPGLTLATGRPDVAAHILRTFAQFVDRGMLPNRFPESGEEPEYNTVDATLWYFEAIRAYYEATIQQSPDKKGDLALLQELFPVLREIITWHRQGTRYGIHVDPTDGLLYAGKAGVQLTWMDAKVGDWVVTPRIGKPVEVNALWYNALRTMADFAHRLGQPEVTYTESAEQTRSGFARFWNEETGYCHDLIDGPQGHDPALRPNQLLAVSLPHSPLDAARQKAVVDICARRLLTSHGMRSLSADDPSYTGHYGGDQRRRDAAYHQGTVWGWLTGPFVRAHLRVYHDPALVRSFLRSLIQHLRSHGLGTMSEIFDGDPPYTPRGCIAQAWSVAEVLDVLGVV